MTRNLLPLHRLQSVIVTKDADFVELADAGLEHSGIVFVQGKLMAGPIVRALRFIYGTTTREQMRNRIEFASQFIDA